MLLLTCAMAWSPTGAIRIVSAADGMFCGSRALADSGSMQWFKGSADIIGRPITYCVLPAP